MTLALGETGDVPETAAAVPLADHLQEHFPLLAQLVVQPKYMLLPSKRNPYCVKQARFRMVGAYIPGAGGQEWGEVSSRGIKEERIIADPSVLTNRLTLRNIPAQSLRMYHVCGP